MFYALAKDLIDTGELRFEHVLKDIETLNREAFEGTYEVTAVSIHAYAHLDEGYALLGSGASMGDGYGPVLVAREPIVPEQLAAKKIAIPGRLTSAALALKMWNPSLQTVTYAFDEIMPAVQSGEVDAGGMPLPLGGNVIRRDLGEEMCARVAALLKESIQYSLDHREEALDYALDYGRGLDREKADRFVGMYVNELTVDYGERGRRAVRDFLDRAANERLIPKVPRLDFL
jgi:1,4-dihydroxy-6-naphthoate synthase